jgi:hypothetical protein
MILVVVVELTQHAPDCGVAVFEHADVLMPSVSDCVYYLAVRRGRASASRVISLFIHLSALGGLW